MALLTLYFDVTSQTLVRGLNNSGRFDLADIYQEDSLVIELSKVKRINYAAAPFFSLESIANDALLISVGTIGNSLAAQNTWTKNTENTVFSGTVALDTVGINALATGTSLIFEIRIFNAGTAYTRGQFPVTYRKSVGLNGTLTTPPPDGALLRTEASEIYMPYELPAGRGITLVSADGTKKILRYLDDDGTIREVNL